MGHLLMVESWVGAMSTLLPRAIHESGHRFTLLTRDLHHYLRAAPTGGVHPLLTAENVLTAETNDPATLLPYLAELHRTLRFDGVLTACDYYLGTAARLAAHLGLPGATPDAVDRACRKDLTRAAMQRAGLPQPAYAVVRGWPAAAEAAREIGYPLVVKPVDLCAGMHVRVVRDADELRTACAAVTAGAVNARQQPRSPLVLLEELLTGPEVSVETVLVDGTGTVVGVTDKSLAGAPWFVESGHMFPAALDPNTARAAADTALAALAAIGLDRGVAHTELRLTPAGPRVVEINPRPAGNRITELVRRVTGIDLPMVYAQLALGETAELTPTDTGVRSAAIAFLLPSTAGTVAGFTGTAALRADPSVVEWTLRLPGHRTATASSNNDYLGHVMVVDPTGSGARVHAEDLVARLAVRYADDPTAADDPADSADDRSTVAADEPAAPAGALTGSAA